MLKTWQGARWRKFNRQAAQYCRGSLARLANSDGLSRAWQVVAMAVPTECEMLIPFWWRSSSINYETLILLVLPGVLRVSNYLGRRWNIVSRCANVTARINGSRSFILQPGTHAWLQRAKHHYSIVREHGPIQSSVVSAQLATATSVMAPRDFSSSSLGSEA
jgi:hypothetical protein